MNQDHTVLHSPSFSTREAAREGQTSEGRHHLLLLQVHDKRDFSGSLHAYIKKARITVCEV